MSVPFMEVGNRGRACGKKPDRILQGKISTSLACFVRSLLQSGEALWMQRRCFRLGSGTSAMLVVGRQVYLK